MFNKALSVATILALLVLLFPDGKDAYDTFITAMLDATSVSSGFAYLLLTNLPYFVLGAVVFRVIWTLISRDKPANMRF